jgi:hypothetical protein
MRRFASLADREPQPQNRLAEVEVLAQAADVEADLNLMRRSDV